MRVVRDADAACDAAVRQARSRPRPRSATRDVYLEKLRRAEPRHIEIQVLADAHGHVVHLGERDCSIQRRHQKLIEESPSPRRAPRDARRPWAPRPSRAARAVGYAGAGTVEFLLDADGELLLHGDEHAPPGRAPGDRDGDRARPREGADRDRRRRAARRSRQDDIDVRRATPSSAGSTPRIPPTASARRPALVGELGSARRARRARRHARLPGLHGPAVLRLAARQADRAGAATATRPSWRGRWALAQFEVGGVKTTIPFHQRVLDHPLFVAGTVSTHFIDDHFA